MRSYRHCDLCKQAHGRVKFESYWHFIIYVHHKDNFFLMVNCTFAKHFSSFLTHIVTMPHQPLTTRHRHRGCYCSGGGWQFKKRRQWKGILGKQIWASLFWNRNVGVLPFSLISKGDFLLHYLFEKWLLMYLKVGTLLWRPFYLFIVGYNFYFLVKRFESWKTFPA